MRTIGVAPTFPPDAKSEDHVDIIYIPPGGGHGDPLAEIAVFALKWEIESGDRYGDLMYLPPKVGRALARKLGLA